MAELSRCAEKFPCYSEARPRAHRLLLVAPEENGNRMSPKPQSRVGLSTAAETAWYDQEPTAEHLPVERSSESRRWLILIGVGVALVAGVLVAASLIGSSRQAAKVASAAPSAPRLETAAAPLSPAASAAPVAPAPAANAAVKPAVTPAKPAAAPARTAVTAHASHVVAAAPAPAHKPAAPRRPAPAPRKPSRGHFAP